MKIKENWHEEFFPDGWDFVQDHMFPPEKTQLEIDFIDSFARQHGYKKILDVPCGTGRITVGLAKKGYELTGIDFNPNVIKIARETSTGLNINYLEGDMRKLSYKEEFDLLTCMWGSFGYFSDEENFDFLCRAAAALRSGGAMIMDAMTIEGIMRFYRPSDTRKTAGGFLVEDRQFDLRNSRIDVEWTFLSKEKHFTRTSSIRLYTYKDLIDMMEKAGFTEFFPYGGYRGEEFSLNNLRLCLCAVKS